MDKILGATTFFVTYGKARFAKSVYLCKDKKNFKFFKKTYYEEVFIPFPIPLDGMSVGICTRET